MLLTPHDAILWSRHFRISGYPCVINPEALGRCQSVRAYYCGCAKAHRFIHDSLQMSKCSEGIGIGRIASGQLFVIISGCLASMYHMHADQTGSSYVTNRVFRSAPAPQDAVKETERGRWEDLTHLPATMAVTVLPLSRFNYALKLFKVFERVNSSMNHDAISISWTSAF